MISVCTKSHLAIVVVASQLLVLIPSVNFVLYDKSVAATFHEDVDAPAGVAYYGACIILCIAIRECTVLERVGSLLQCDLKESS